MIATVKYHIHVDALELSTQFHELLVTELGFYTSDFAGHPEGEESFEPVHHYTRKLNSGPEFQEVFTRVSQAANGPQALQGYIEGEYLPYDVDFEEKPFDPSIVPPVERLSLGFLEGGTFRESEIHVVMHADRSDSRLLAYLSGIGLFSAYMDKPYGRAIVFTAGGDRTIVETLGSKLKQYLEEAGGSANCSIKEERVIKYWLSGPAIKLPPVVKELHWH